MKYEVIETSTGARMARTKPGEIMSNTLFDSFDAALDWLREKGLSETHIVIFAKGMKNEVPS